MKKTNKSNLTAITKEDEEFILASRNTLTIPETALYLNATEVTVRDVLRRGFAEGVFEGTEKKATIDYAFPPIDNQVCGVIDKDTFEEMIELSRNFPKAIGESFMAGLLRGYLWDKHKPIDKTRFIKFIYESHTGASGYRAVVPQRLYYGTHDHYPEPGWLLEGYDLDKDQIRTFALNKLIF